ncbi:MAG TPA: Gfo/Idh/MocA family oxidoreductase [Myxococcaceae bacterium]
MKTAVIGAGQIARQHLTCLGTLPGVEVVAVCDLSPSVAECAAERHHVPRWFTDHRTMLAEARPDVVHVTTPPGSHFRIAQAALEAGAHVIVEKPATPTLAELEALAHKAEEHGLLLVEDYNYLFNQAPLEILRRVESGALGTVVHVEVTICLSILGPDGFADPNAPHPALALRGGALADFLPHLASLAHLFVGPHQSARTAWVKRSQTVLPYDEFRAVVEAERGTASLAFSASAQPDAFWLRVYGTRTQASANLFETRLTFDGLRPGPKPLRPFLNGLAEAKAIRRSAIGTLLRKFTGGPGSYEGLFELLGRTYRALQHGGAPPVTLRQVLEVNRMEEALRPPAGESVVAPLRLHEGGRG